VMTRVLVSVVMVWFLWLPWSVGCGCREARQFGCWFRLVIAECGYLIPP